jgi:hypothetical protein
MSTSAYKPLTPARHPVGGPDFKPEYRVLVHRKFANHWNEVVQRVGEQAAEQFWNHVALTPGEKCAVGSTTILRGEAGRPKGVGWSRTYHFEISGAGRIDYQFHNAYKIHADGDEHPVVAILTINYGSH